MRKHQNNHNGSPHEGVPQPDTFTYHEDPGHGWLEVPFALLCKLGIEQEISGFSYRSKDEKTAYLEEDMDVMTFLKAYESLSGFTMDEITTRCGRNYQEHSYIRDLPAYRY